MRVNVSSKKIPSNQNVEVSTTIYQIFQSNTAISTPIDAGINSNITKDYKSIDMLSISFYWWKEFNFEYVSFIHYQPITRLYNSRLIN